MISSVKKFGNSAGVIIPKPLLSEVGVEAGDSVEMHVEGDRIVIERVVKSIRQGWAEDAKRIAAEGDDHLVWPEFTNEEDGKLKW
ncbi:antitoxin MazE [Pararhizobium capsulatum DSM 1112]|uniref:Antitoxin MazE n=1 Tax=Pararhizobium capsulatum DSM 1112 TaxID=1121113 RepID=A0ABU0BXW6_9HYPH|nr:AbrB/MazE/SpoVT family DNA-binding domain-containing protein [Pararhizobium capsulatum]MDQ0322554.1 antitoxin MazE [Pararhizobium capsulatum DSM 1112]